VTASPVPTEAPTATPVVTASPVPTEAPTEAPVPTVEPTATPVVTASPVPTEAPTEAPTASPVPTEAPTATPVPTVAPTATPVATANPVPTAAPAQKPTSTPVQASQESGKPFLQDDTGKTGWDVIRRETDKAQEGDTIKINMNGATSVPGNVFDDIKGKDITITLDMGNGVSWTINGKTITADKVNDINFEVKVGTKENPVNTIPVEIVNKVTGERQFVNISLVHDGELGLTAILNVNLDAKNAGLFANLFYYNERFGTMQFVWADDIDQYGTAHLVFNHASEYTIVIDREIMSGNATAPKTDDESSSLPFGLIMLTLLSLGAGAYVSVKKRKRL